jgi:glutamyl-tRNA synthetase
MEDTDQNREKEGSVRRILEGLQWLGMEADEGVYLDEQGNIAEKGSYGPYIQSARKHIYQEYAQKLLETGHGYRCFCSAERLDQMRADQQANHQPPRYDRLCRHLSKEESDRRAAAGERYVIRQAIPSKDFPDGPSLPEGGVVTLHDLIHDGVTINVEELDDHVLLKSDGYPTYQLANVIDDHLMEITHVLRGVEYISSAPKNILLYQAFGWELPIFVHTPLILGQDKSKLAKRHGAKPVLEYRDMGYIPDALINVLAFLGWSPGTEEEFMTRDDLIKRFDITRVQKSPAIFNPGRLDYVNGWYIRQMAIGEVVDYMLPRWITAGLLVPTTNTSDPKAYISYQEATYTTAEPITHPQATLAEYLQTAAHSVQEKIRHFDETATLTWFFFRRPVVNAALKELSIPKKADPERIKTIFTQSLQLLESIPDGEWVHDKIEEELRVFIGKNEYNNAEVLWPIRAALTGEVASPGSFEMLTVLGKNEALLRLRPLAG